jgi:predicted nucleic acid-binding protein
VDEERVFISVISFAEIRRGVEMLPIGRRRESLAQWLAEDLAARFENRILGVDRQIAERWGVIMVRGPESRPDGRLNGRFCRGHGVRRTASLS